MKRCFSLTMKEPTEYQLAAKRVNLVERNENPIGYQLLNKYRIGVHEETDIVELANEIKHADDALRNNAAGKLTLILEQIRFLQSQAETILAETHKNKELHEAACNFQKKTGTIYHLYQRESGQKYLSMLSPMEWGMSLPHEFLGSFRLENDQSWTPIDQIAAKIKQTDWAHKLLNSSSTKQSFMAIEENMDDNGKMMDEN